MKRRLTRTVLCALLLAGSSAAALGDRVTYTFTGRHGDLMDPIQLSFVAALDNYVQMPVRLDRSALVECYASLLPCTAVTLHPIDPFGGSWSMVSFETQYIMTYFYFPLGALQQPGRYRSVATDLNVGHIRIVGPPVPEPATALLHLVGVVLVGTVLHRASRH